MGTPGQASQSPRDRAVGGKTHHRLYRGQGWGGRREKMEAPGGFGWMMKEPALPTSLPGILPKSLSKAFPSPPARILTSFTAQIKNVNKPTHECAYTHTHTHTHTHTQAHKERCGPSHPGDQLSGLGIEQFRPQPETRTSEVQGGAGGPAGVLITKEIWSLPWWLSGKESTHQCRRHRFNPWSRKISHVTEQLSPLRAVLQSPGTSSREAAA